MTFKEAEVQDLDVFTNPDEFGVQAVFSRSGLTINVLLDNEPDPETGRFVDYVTVSLSDVAGVQVDDTFTVGVDVYKVVVDKPIPLGGLMGMIRVEK